jgi:hypothetical protein
MQRVRACMYGEGGKKDCLYTALFTVAIKQWLYLSTEMFICYIF